MIGLGAKYLTAAGFGRYRITAASLGNLDLLGWLLHATRQAILGAFGDDGMAVINATNAYLNGIAASDRDKATALADIINQWPTISEYVVLYGDSFANLVVDNNMSFETPRYAIDAQTVAERTWLIRSPANFTNWTDIETLLAQTDWEYLPGGFTNKGNYVSLEGTRTSSNKTILKFFVPSQMPTGLAESYADNIWVYINGVQVWGKNGSWHANKVTHDLDFSNIIRVGKVNYIESSWTGSGGNGIDIGLY